MTGSTTGSHTGSHPGSHTGSHTGSHPGPHTVAVIPARGGSKGVPGKNLMRIGGVSLVARAVRACRAATAVDAVYVSTDDADIARAALAAGAGVISRPAELAGDTASSEAALEHALGYLDWVDVATDILVFVQCTSPFLDPRDLDRAVRIVVDGDADSVFAGVETYDFLWRGVPGRGPVDLVEGQNHDRSHRPRRQERNPDYRETGAFYVMDGPGFRAARHRFFGRTAVVGVPALTAIEIDTLDDVALAAALAPVLDPGLDPRPLLDVDAVITDFDGVHTDDTAFVDQSGGESVRVSRGDGLGVERLRRAGVPLLIVSKETNPVVRARAAKLGVEVLHGVEHKTEVVRDWLRAHGIPPARTAYLGNDVNDLGPMGLVGWPVAVADAQPEVRAAARRVLSRGGGHGAVRELCDLVLSARASVADPPSTAQRPTLVAAAGSDGGRSGPDRNGSAPAAAGPRHAAG
jgi:YrbI family 3-deoxy-D-manno-octulosonate 8-phosphate phosphatase